MLVEFEDVIHVNELGLTHTSHDVGGNECGQLQSVVTFSLSLSLGVDGQQEVFKELLHGGIVVLVQTLDNIHGYSVYVVLFQVVDIFNEGLDRLTRCEQLADRLVYAEVGDAHTHGLVEGVQDRETEVNEQIRAHKLVTEELLHQ